VEDVVGRRERCWWKRVRRTEGPVVEVDVVARGCEECEEDEVAARRASGIAGVCCLG